MAEDIPSQVQFQRNWDKDAQHEIEEGLKDLTTRVTGYCAETGTTFISDPSVVASIAGKATKIIQTSKQLYLKYHETTKEIKDPKTKKVISVEPTEGYTLLLNFEKEVTTAFNIDANYLRIKLKEIQEHEIQDIAVKHKLMDRTTEKEPWEREVEQRFFP
jgi:hypothetical protein